MLLYLCPFLHYKKEISALFRPRGFYWPKSPSPCEETLIHTSLEEVTVWTLLALAHTPSSILAQKCSIYLKSSLYKKKGQRLGRAGGQEGGQSWPPDGHIGGQAWVALLKRTRQSQSLIYRELISVVPRGASKPFFSGSFNPQPEPDKGFFTWQSAMEAQGRGKERPSFQLPMWSKSPFLQEFAVTWFLFKTERWNGTFRFFDMQFLNVKPAWMLVALKQECCLSSLNYNTERF